MNKNKVHPPFVERKVIIGQMPMNFVHFYNVKYDIIRLHLLNETSRTNRTSGSSGSSGSSGTNRTSNKQMPDIYKNTKTNRYYMHDIYGLNSYFSSYYLFDITDAYDWENMLKENVFSDDYKTKQVQHMKLLFEMKKYYAGSPEYDSLYPPIK